MSGGMTELEYEVRIDRLKQLVSELHDLCERTHGGIGERLYSVWMEDIERHMSYFGIEVKE